MRRVRRDVLLVSTLLLSWLGMMAVHELGHVLGAAVSGGRVVRVVLHPLTISRTDLAENPRPLLVTWAGPVVGCLLPVLAWATAQRARLPGWYLPRFFAGFCLIVNGAYLGAGSFERAGDAGDLLRHGAPAWQLWLFALLTVPPGFLLWHRLGPHFGLGPGARAIPAPLAYGSLGALLLVLALLLFCDSR